MENHIHLFQIMKQLEITEYLAIADLRTRQRAIASHYTDIAINRENLEAQAIANLKAKNLNLNHESNHTATN